MSGPIVRTAPTPKFSENWEKAFGKKTAATKAAVKPSKSVKTKKRSKSKKKG